MPKPHALVVLALVLVCVPGCKKKQQEVENTGHDMGAGFLQQQVKQPIDRAHAAADATERMAPALLDASQQMTQFLRG